MIRESSQYGVGPLNDPRPGLKTIERRVQAYHQGDSGAKVMPTISGTGQIHWRAKGSLSRRSGPSQLPQMLCADLGGPCAPVRPLRLQVEDAAEDARRDDLPDNLRRRSRRSTFAEAMVQSEVATHPAEVDVGGEVGTEGNRSEFGSVGDGEGLEDSEAACGRSSKLATCFGTAARRSHVRTSSWRRSNMDS